MAATILLTGACGQIGSELTLALRARFGTDQVVATDIRLPEGELANGPFELLDVMDAAAVQAIIRKHQPEQVYHLAAMLSATAEKYPLKGWALNMDSLLYMLEAAADNGVKKVFWPSSIGAFGKHSPKVNTPQYTVMDPSTVYGISKLAGEGWCQYYWEKKGLDVRSIRYPGLISYASPPGGGTTDYAIDIFYQALEKQHYVSFLGPDTMLPMMYMPDAIRGTLQLMDAPVDQITVRSSYNLAGISFTPAQIAAAIQQHIPRFSIEYKPDFRQQIADSWPGSIDDSQARLDWGWQPDYDLTAMTADMLAHIQEKLKSPIVG